MKKFGSIKCKLNFFLKIHNCVTDQLQFNKWRSLEWHSQISPKVVVHFSKKAPRKSAQNSTANSTFWYMNIVLGIFNFAFSFFSQISYKFKLNELNEFSIDFALVGSLFYWSRLWFFCCLSVSRKFVGEYVCHQRCHLKEGASFSALN